jgi:uncharacterized protein YcaQ
MTSSTAQKTPDYVITPTVARRLAIYRQRLAGPRPPATAEGILDVARDLGCLQLDPTRAVARSHLLVLWSRLGAYDPAQLDRLMWDERKLFEDWAHCASIVLTEDYPIFAALKDRHAGQVQAWMAENAEMRSHVLDLITERGPLPVGAFDDRAAVRWQSQGWNAGRNTDRMLAFLWSEGRVMVAGRTKSGQKLYDLTERCLPDWTPRETLNDHEVTRRGIERALRALGAARPQHIGKHFIRNRYHRLDHVLAELVNEGRIVPVVIRDPETGQGLPGSDKGGWYVHTDDLPLIERLAAGEWEGRTTLLSPFDNLICDRDRTEQLFDFRFRLEIYTPKVQRRYGFFVMPILRDDRLIGRVDPSFDRKNNRLLINAIHLEPGADDGPGIARAVGAALADLAAFLGAQDIGYGGVDGAAKDDTLPPGWAGML